MKGTGGDRRYTRAELARKEPATVKPMTPHHRELKPWIEARLVERHGRTYLELKCHHCGKVSIIQSDTPELHNSAIQSFVSDHFFRANQKLCRHDDKHGKDCFCKRERPRKKKIEQLTIPGT